ncbi:hypothetical protein G6F40_014704 [Rhizopus arrhizus]|nr:hypothetical protein G6F40_014704 [Rhizopus arrhizus]
MRCSSERPADCEPSQHRLEAKQGIGAHGVGGLAEQSMLDGGGGPEQADRGVAFACSVVHHLREQCLGAFHAGEPAPTPAADPRTPPACARRPTALGLRCLRSGRAGSAAPNAGPEPRRAGCGPGASPGSVHTHARARLPRRQLRGVAGRPSNPVPFASAARCSAQAPGHGTSLLR